MEILELINSPKPTKRFRITLDIGGKIKHYDFGDPNGFTFVDGATEQTRNNYRKRHLANIKERERIIGNIPSPALFSYKILWGDSPDIMDNLIQLNSELADI